MPQFERAMLLGLLCFAAANESVVPLRFADAAKRLQPHACRTPPPINSNTRATLKNLSTLSDGNAWLDASKAISMTATPTNMLPLTPPAGTALAATRPGNFDCPRHLTEALHVWDTEDGCTTLKYRERKQDN